MRVTFIVEGDGDVLAFPTLLSRVSEGFGLDAYTDRPIKSGGYHKLVRPGELERFCIMATNKPAVDLVIIAVDLDDHCPKEKQEEFRARIDSIPGLGPPSIKICFLKREYESLFLASFDVLRATLPEYDWDVSFECAEPEQVRNAKGRINEAMGRHYKEVVDQKRLTSGLDIWHLYRRSRSFRHIMKSLTNLEYAELDEIAA